MECLINQIILEAFAKGKDLQEAQKLLAQKHILIEIETLEKRSQNIKKVELQKR